MKRVLDRFQTAVALFMGFHKTDKLFWSIAGAFAVLWVLLPTFFQPGYRPDVVELQLIGKEWVLATRKHPMLPAWILEILNILTGRSFAAPFIASQLCILIALGSVWGIARRVLTPRAALLGTLAILPYWFFTVESIKFNQNVVLIAFWTLSIALYFRAIQRNRLFDWIVAGVSLGLAFHAKYSAVFLVFALVVYSIMEPDQRRLWKEKGLYISALVASLVFLPHLVWLVRNDFVTFSYVEMSTESTAVWANHLVSPVVFFLNEAGYLLSIIPPLLPCLFGRARRRTVRKNTPAGEAERYLFYCITVPFLSHLLISACKGTYLNAEYGAPFWPFFGVYLFLRFRTKFDQKRFCLSFCGIMSMEAIMVVALLLQSIASPYWTGRPQRFHFPIRELGARCDRIWDSRFQEPCPYVSGDWWIAGNAAIGMKDRPSVHFYWRDIDRPEVRPTGTWSEDSDVNESGGLVFWSISGFYWRGKRDYPQGVLPEYVRERFPRAELFPEPLELSYKTGKYIELRIGVAVIPPKNEKSRINDFPR